MELEKGLPSTLYGYQPDISNDIRSKCWVYLKRLFIEVAKEANKPKMVITTGPAYIDRYIIGGYLGYNSDFVTQICGVLSMQDLISEYGSKIALTTKGMNEIMVKDRELFTKVTGHQFDNIEAEQPDTAVIRSGDKRKGRNELAKAFLSLTGDIRICDPYVDGTLGIFIAKIDFDNANSIRVLTVRDDSQKKTPLDIATLRKCYPIDIRYFDTKPKPPLHDRYILSDSYSYKIGSSMSDLGNKDTEIDPMTTQQKDDWARTFEERWDQAKP